MKTEYTPGPWKIMADPVNEGRHEYHDNRWIATEDAEVEFGHDPRSWTLTSGSLLCEMRDGTKANARLIAAAPDLLEALQACVERMAVLQEHTNYPLAWPRVQAMDAIAKATAQ